VCSPSYATKEASTAEPQFAFKNRYSNAFINGKE